MTTTQARTALTEALVALAVELGIADKTTAFAVLAGVDTLATLATTLDPLTAGAMRDKLRSLTDVLYDAAADRIAQLPPPPLELVRTATVDVDVPGLPPLRQPLEQSPRESLGFAGTMPAPPPDEPPHMCQNAADCHLSARECWARFFGDGASAPEPPAA